MGFIADALDSIASLPQPAVVAAAGLLTFGECSIGLGLIVPGEIGLLIAATTIRSVSDFLIMWVVVAACAVASDSVGYYLGHRFGDRMRASRAVRKMGQEHWDKAGVLLRKHGGWAVFFARFLPVVRALTPAAAGAAKLPYRRFLPVSILGGSLYAALHITLGAVLGEAAKRIESVMSTAGLAVVGGLALILIITVTVKRRKAKRAAESAAAEPEREAAV